MVQKSHFSFSFFFEQAVSKPPLILRWIDSYRPRPALLTDSCGRGHHRQRHGGVFVRVCGTGRCGECVIEVPQLTIVPPFWGRSARRGGAAGAGNVSIHRHHSVPAWAVPVCGWLFIDIAIVASSVLAFPLVEGGMESDRWEQWFEKKKSPCLIKCVQRLRRVAYRWWHLGWCVAMVK